MSKKIQQFLGSEVVSFSEDAYVVDSCIAKEKALELFQFALGKELTIESVMEDYIRFRKGGDDAPDPDERNEFAYYLGAQKGRGAHQVWRVTV